MTRNLFAFSLTFIFAVCATGKEALLRAGDNYGLSSDAAGANASYNAAMLENPRLSLDMGFLLRKSRVGLELGDAELARAILLRAQDLAVSGRDIGQTDWLLGLDAFFVGDYPAARNAFSSVILYHPNPPLELLYYLGWALYKTGDYEAARNVFLNLVDLNSGRFSAEELDVLLAAVDLQSAHFAVVLDRLKEAPSYPRDVWYREEALFMAGYSAFRIDSIEKARGFFSCIEDSSLRITSLARLELEEADFKEAALLYSHLKNEEGVYGQAIALYLDGNLSEAERLSENYVMENSQGKYKSETYLLLALIQRDRSNSNQAIALLKQGLELDSPSRPVLLQTLAEMQFTAQKYKEASGTLNELLGSHPKPSGDETTRLLLARSLFYLGENDTAQTLLKILLDATGDEVIANEARFYLGEIAARQGNYALAAQEFANVTQGSLYPQALKRQGEALASAGQHNQAIDVLRASLAVTTASDEREALMLKIEESRLALGVYPDRITMLKRYIENYPNTSLAPKLQLEVALEYIEQNNCIAAMHEINKLLDRYPKSEAAPEALEYKARCQRRLGYTEEAIVTYREIPKLFPESIVVARSQRELAQLLFSVGKTGEALAVYRELSSTSSNAADRASYTLSMAEIYHSMGNHQTAADLIDVAINESSSSTVSKRALLLGTKTELARGNLPAARRYAERYRGLFGETAEYLLHRGAIDRAQGKLQDALSAYSEAAARFPQRSESRIESLIGAAEAAQMLGRADAARRFLEEASREVQIDRQRIEITRRLQALE